MSAEPAEVTLATRSAFSARIGRSPDGVWPAYAAGPVWALAQEGVEVGGLDLVIDSDVPVGSGLSSSAALECAVVLAVRDLYGGPDDTARLALIDQRAEHEVVGVPCGIMDQMASMACTAGHVLLLDCRSLAAEQVPLALADNGLVLLVIDTRVSHALADGAYTERERPRPRGRGAASPWPTGHDRRRAERVARVVA
jgi:galactokinase